VAKKDSKQAEKKDQVGQKKVDQKAGKQAASKQPASKQSAGKRPAELESTDGFSANAFAQGTREELAKVIWPTRQQLISESAAVILMVSLSATIIYFVDKLFGWGSRLIF
jgi:preprotein translocase subunit SecE